MEGSLVWVPNLDQGYELAEVDDVTADGVSARPRSGGKSIAVSFDRAFPADDHDKPDVADNCGMWYLNEASLLHNLRKRYEKGHIYTYTANILIAVNPYKQLPIYDAKSLAQYKGKSLGLEPPHVYAIADKCYREMRSSRVSQSVVVSGESGSGKTETTKFLVRFLTDTGKGGTGDIEQRIVEANPLLEAFGNAKTTRNHNSSRFGKFIEIHFDAQAKVAGAFISHYLLEKSRVCTQSPEERNYHVFYGLCRGAPADMKGALNLGDPSSFNYLKKGILDPIPGIDDAKDFNQLCEAMTKTGFSEEEKADVFRIASAVLHIGNIDFCENQADSKGGSMVASSGENALKGSSALLAVDAEDLRSRLSSRMMSTTRGGAQGTIYRVPLDVTAASAARDALAKALYSKLFDWIVGRINKGFEFTDSMAYCGVLDIAGFEYFQHNSFEQFCINFCNEKLQQFFNDKVLKQEQELYRQEAIKFKEIDYVDNQDCIDLIEENKAGIFYLLDEESKMPQCNDGRFAQSVHDKHRKHFRFANCKKAKLNIHKKLNDTEGFVIRHFAGAVCYETAGFIEKNNDALHADLEALMDESKDDFLKGLFGGTDGGAPKKSAGGRGKLSHASVGDKFKKQLNILMDKLGSTQASFIRCIKPNLLFEPGTFSGGEILSQLQCAGMVQVLELLQGGFPSRTSFADLYNIYKDKLDPVLAKLDARTFCEALFFALEMNPDDFQFGTSKVFFGAGKFAEFDRITDSDQVAGLVKKVRGWLVRKRWKKAIFGALSVIKLSRKIAYRQQNRIQCQKWIKRWLAQQEMAPKIEAAYKKRLEKELAKAKAAEQARIKAALEAEAKRKAEEERKRLEIEEERRKHQEMEARRKEEEKEAAAAAAKYEAERKVREAEEEAERKEEQKRLALQEQERRDTELAQRLAQDDGKNAQKVDVEETAPVKKAEGAVKTAKHDLSKWKYSDLRDTINSSTDIELLSACREEFHRRLKVYHAWKMKHQKKGGSAEPSHTPEFKASAAPPPPTRTTSKAETREKRYFKIPFIRPSTDNKAGGGGKNMYKKKGWWLACFAGQWVERQLELHADRSPVLLVAGKDDHEMCEMSLNETGLSHKRGAEITAAEFEKAWADAGGKPPKN